MFIKIKKVSFDLYSKTTGTQELDIHF